MKTKSKKKMVVQRYRMSKKIFSEREINQQRELENYFAAFNGWKLK